MNNKLENYSFCKTIKYPASIFFDNYLGYDDINYFNNSYKSDIDKRLELGLKINKDEYNDIKNKNWYWHIVNFSYNKIQCDGDKMKKLLLQSEIFNNILQYVVLFFRKRTHGR